MTHEQKMMSMRGNNIPFARATVFHELIPGHDLQGYMAARYRPYRRFSDALLDRGLGALLGDALLGPGFRADAGGEDGHVVLAHAPLRADYFLAELPSWTTGRPSNAWISWLTASAMNETTPQRKCGVPSTDVRPAVPGAYMLGALQFRSLHRELVEIGQDDEPPVSRRDPARKCNSRRDGSRHIDGSKAHAEFHFFVEVLRSHPGYAVGFGRSRERGANRTREDGNRTYVPRPRYSRIRFGLFRPIAGCFSKPCVRTTLRERACRRNLRNAVRDAV